MAIAKDYKKDYGTADNRALVCGCKSRIGRG